MELYLKEPKRASVSGTVRSAKRKLTVWDVIHYYLAHYCSPVPIMAGCKATMWSEMNEIQKYYQECVEKSPDCYTMRDIVGMCVRGLYTTGHQKRVKAEAISEAVDKLMRGKFHDNKSGKDISLIKGKKIYDKFLDFEELYDAVRQIIGNVNGLGYVTLYDTARRLDHLLVAPIYPCAYVYIHYNKVNRAARSIIKKELGYREPANSFVADFGIFPSIVIEDILCVFSDVFVSCVVKKDDADETVIKSKNSNWRQMPLSVFLNKMDAQLQSKGDLNRWDDFKRR